MTEPSIDEMLIWVSGLEHWNPDTLNDNKVMLRAIRAILEQSRPMERGKGLLLMHPNDIDRGKLEAIRAFVERVEKRPEHWKAAIMNELAAMEKENENP